jgi:hypothetical protein
LTSCGVSNENEPYQLIDPVGGQRVRVRFDGVFKGVETRWDGELVTLSHYCRQGGSGVGHTLRPFIEIGAASSEGRRLRVCLDVPVIDQPTIAKTVIMVRNYRRLHVGRIEFGDAFDCPGQ